MSVCPYTIQIISSVFMFVHIMEARMVGSYLKNEQPDGCQ